MLLAHHSKWEEEERKFWKKDYVHPNLKQALHSIEIVDVRKFTNVSQVIEFLLWDKVIYPKRRRELQNFANNAARQFLTGVSNKKSILLSILDLRIT